MRRTCNFGNVKNLLSWSFFSEAELQRIQEERRKLSLELQAGDLVTDVGLPNVEDMDIRISSFNKRDVEENQEQRGALRAQVEQLQQKNDQQTRRVTDLEADHDAWE